MAGNKKSSYYDQKLYQTRIYRIWYNMKTRCNNKNSACYKLYGLRGITYDKKWETFQGFYEDMKEGYDDLFQLDRIDNNGNYCKENCRWVTRLENSNNRRDNIFINFDNKNMTLSQWGRYLGIKGSTLRQRYFSYKWPIEKCLTYNLK